MDWLLLQGIQEKGFTPGKPLPAIGLSAVTLLQEQDGCPLPVEVTGITCLFLQLPCLSFSREICIQL